MGTRYHFRCVTCGVTEKVDDERGYLDEVQAMIRAAPAIAEMAPLASFLDLRVNGYASIRAAFFVEHAGHDLRPIDDMGHLENECGAPITCRCCGLELARCHLDMHHAGEHAEKRP